MKDEKKGCSISYTLYRERKGKLVDIAHLNFKWPPLLLSNLKCKKKHMQAQKNEKSNNQEHHQESGNLLRVNTVNIHVSREFYLCFFLIGPRLGMFFVQK